MMQISDVELEFALVNPILPAQLVHPKTKAKAFDQVLGEWEPVKYS